jgi:2,4-didehydro-3-deoxy-L-rhamnonate hydrolase
MSTRFSLGTLSRGGGAPFAGVVLEDRVFPVEALQAICERMGVPLSGTASTLDLLVAWEQNFAALSAGVAAGRDDVASLALDELRVHAPILHPRQIFCAGANYRQHVIELVVDDGGGPQTEHLSPEERRAWATSVMDERAASGTPYIFTKLPSSITGPYDPVVLPADVSQPDWELELGVIIGRAARRVSRKDALSYVAGYTIVNDITSRDRTYRRDLQPIGADWVASKCSPTFLPMGPFLVPAAFVPDPQRLHITLELNGHVMQDESTSDMLFGVARLIEYASSLAQLWPGDLLCTGSPRGNGTHYNRFLQPGDVMRGTITGLGELRNPCIAEGAEAE